eukprot:jgi/Botrbrau1/1672/Bobra.116_2s0016.1
MGRGHKTTHSRSPFSIGYLRLPFTPRRPSFPSTPLFVPCAPNSRCQLMRDPRRPKPRIPTPPRRPAGRLTSTRPPPPPAKSSTSARYGAPCAMWSRGLPGPPGDPPPWTVSKGSPPRPSVLPSVLRPAPARSTSCASAPRPAAPRPEISPPASQQVVLQAGAPGPFGDLQRIWRAPGALPLHVCWVPCRIPQPPRQGVEGDRRCCGAPEGAALHVRAGTPWLRAHPRDKPPPGVCRGGA